ncbi:hypothetical protein CMI37_10420 [Candidatus Pacearchaeota archaeon]|nr:hypothetical protein [Candidatus Pacearchaeota archaeon]
MSPEQITQALSEGRTEQEVENFIRTGKAEEGFDFSVGRTIENIPRSAGRLVGDIAGVVRHPIQTAKGLARVAGGAVAKAIPGEQPIERLARAEERPTEFDAVIDFFKERFGGAENILRTLEEDPVGFAADISSVLTGGGAVVAGAGKAAKVGALARAGRTAGRVGRAVDPVAQVAGRVGRRVKGIGARRRVAPLARSVDVPATEAAGRLGFQPQELTATVRSQSKVVPILESLVGKGLFGTKIADTMDRAVIKLQQVADQLVQSTKRSPDLVSVGENIVKGADDYRRNFETVKNAAYSALDAEAKRIPAQLDNTRVALEEIIERKQSVIGGGSDLKFFTDKLKGIVDPKKPLTFENVKQTRTELGRMLKSGDPFVTGNQGLLKRLYASLSDDLDATALATRPELSPILQEANKVYREGLQLMNSEFGRKIQKFKNQPDKILPAIITPAMSSEDIPRIFELIGPDNVPNVQAAVLEDIFSKAKSKATEGFTPTGITTQVNKYGEKLTTLLDAEQFKALKDIETVSKKFAKGAKIAEGSQTAFLGRIFGEMSLLFVNPWLAAKTIFGDAVFSKFVTSKAGQDLLTTGVGLSPGTARALERGGRVVETIAPRGRDAFQVRRAVRVSENEQ